MPTAPDHRAATVTERSDLALTEPAAPVVESSAIDAPPHAVSLSTPHLNSRSERPSQGNTLEAGLGAHSSPTTAASAVKNHAIKRWRAHIPRPKNVPEPDGSWRQECPCGNQLPCTEHGDMPNRARGYKPQHPDYRFLLEQVGVPYYIPTAEELGCTPEVLAQACDLFAHNPRLTHPPDPRFNPFRKNLS